MASTGFEAKDGEKQSPQGRSLVNKASAAKDGEVDEAVPNSPTDGESVKPVYDHTHRRLKSRHIQLIGIGGSMWSPAGKSVYRSDSYVELE
ncbi:MAG: hypothetical protein Q9225_001089 [Loekoesia sp. 1 TL-2023]